MKGVYKLNLSCGRQGDLEGLFIADDKVVEYLINNDIYVDFGEVLGKHSDICCTVDSTDIKLITQDETVVSIIEDNELESGHNPLQYPIACWEMEVDSDLYFDDWTVHDYINWKLNDVLPSWMNHGN